MPEALAQLDPAVLPIYGDTLIEHFNMGISRGRARNLGHAGFVKFMNKLPIVHLLNLLF